MNTHFFNILKGFGDRQTMIALALCSLVSACATNNIPGGYTYHLYVTSEPGTLKPGTRGRFDYSRYRGNLNRSGGGGKQGVGEFNSFYPLEIEWVSASGVKRKENLDIARLVDGMREKIVFAPSYESLASLLVDVNGEDLNVYFVHHRYHSARTSTDHTRFLLYASDTNS